MTHANLQCNKCKAPAWFVMLWHTSVISTKHGKLSKTLILLSLKGSFGLGLKIREQMYTFKELEFSPCMWSLYTQVRKQLILTGRRGRGVAIANGAFLSSAQIEFRSSQPHQEGRNQLPGGIFPLTPDDCIPLKKSSTIFLYEWMRVRCAEIAQGKV